MFAGFELISDKVLDKLDRKHLLNLSMTYREGRSIVQEYIWRKPSVKSAKQLAKFVDLTYDNSRLSSYIIELDLQNLKDLVHNSGSEKLRKNLYQYTIVLLLRCFNLNKLKIKTAVFNSKDLTKISNMVKQLTELKVVVDSENANNALLDNLASNTLTRLVIEQKIQIKKFEFLANFPQLIELELANLNEGNEDIWKEVSKCNNLQSLCLKSCSTLTVDFVSELSKLCSLKILTLIDCDISDKIIKKIICQVHNLKQIKIILPGKMLPRIILKNNDKKSPKIFTVEGLPMNNEIIGLISVLHKDIDYIYASNCDYIDEATLIILSKTIKHISTLQLHNCKNVDNEFLEILIRYCSNTLIDVSLEKCNIKDSSLVCNLIEKARNLKSLSIRSSYYTQHNLIVGLNKSSLESTRKKQLNTPCFKTKLIKDHKNVVTEIETSFSLPENQLKPEETATIKKPVNKTKQIPLENLLNTNPKSLTFKQTKDSNEKDLVDLLEEYQNTCIVNSDRKHVFKSYNELVPEIIINDSITNESSNNNKTPTNDVETKKNSSQMQQLIIEHDPISHPDCFKNSQAHNQETNSNSTALNKEKVNNLFSVNSQKISPPKSKQGFEDPKKESCDYFPEKHLVVFETNRLVSANTVVKQNQNVLNGFENIEPKAFQNQDAFLSNENNTISTSKRLDQTKDYNIFSAKAGDENAKKQETFILQNTDSASVKQTYQKRNKRDTFSYKKQDPYFYNKEDLVSVKEEPDQNKNKSKYTKELLDEMFQQLPQLDNHLKYINNNEVTIELQLEPKDGISPDWGLPLANEPVDSGWNSTEILKANRIDDNLNIIDIVSQLLWKSYSDWTFFDGKDEIQKDARLVTNTVINEKETLNW